MTNDRLGNAQWEPQTEVAHRYRFEPGRFWLGRAEDGTGIGYNDDRHICLVSGNRGGKGTSVIVNNLCYWPGSAVVIDPKGENATVTAARRGRGDDHCEGMGQAVHVLDPFRAAQVDESYLSAFNPLDALDPEREESIDEAARLANAIVLVKDDAKEPFFDESARWMVRGLILHVLTDASFDPWQRNLLTVRDLILRGEWRLADIMRQDGAAEIDPPQRLLWRAVEQNPAFGGAVAGTGSRFLAMFDTSPKTYEGVLQAAAVQTEFLDSPGMRRVLASSTFRLADLKAAPAGMTLYLSLPQRYMDTHFKWLRMMTTLILSEMEIVRGRPATGHRVLMVLDEFAGLKRMTSIESAVAQIAGFGVKLFFVLQSLEQLKSIYKDHWETFLSNAGLKIFFSIEDHFTRDYVSKLIGETEIVREVQSVNEGQTENESVAHGTSQSFGRSQSNTTGTSFTENEGRSQSGTTGTSFTENEGRSRSHSQSQNQGTSWSEGQSESVGSSRSNSVSNGASQGISYRERYTFLNGWKQDRTSLTYSSGSNSSSSESYGTNESRSVSTNRGGSSGTSQGVTDGTSSGVTRGRSQSTTDGTSSGVARGRSQSTTDGTTSTQGTSETTTHGTSRTSGSGRSETLHKRLLLPPDEMGKLFARIDDPQNPAFPGFGLALVAGSDPFVILRRNYFEDVQFIDCFSPHPDHEFIAPVEETVGNIGPMIEDLTGVFPGTQAWIKGWMIRKGDVVSVETPVAVLKCTYPDGSFIFNGSSAELSTDANILMPREGKISAAEVLPFDPPQSPEMYQMPPGDVFRLKYYPRVSGPTCSPFSVLEALLDYLRQEAARKAVQPPTGAAKPKPAASRAKSISGTVAIISIISCFRLYSYGNSPGPKPESLLSIFLVLIAMAIFSTLLWLDYKFRQNPRRPSFLIGHLALTGLIFCGLLYWWGLFVMGFAHPFLAAKVLWIILPGKVTLGLTILAGLIWHHLRRKESGQAPA